MADVIDYEQEIKYEFDESIDDHHKIKKLNMEPIVKVLEQVIYE